MTLLADRLGYVQLAEPVRFTAAWERAASLRLRQGDATALDEYDQHGRIRGAPPDQAMDQAARAYVASYLAGRDVLLMAADWARCRELSARIRDDLIHLGLVDDGRTIRIADGAEASAGDLIICRRQRPRASRRASPAGPWPTGTSCGSRPSPADGIMVRRLLDPDRATGQRRFTDRAFRYDGYQSADLAYAITGHSAQGATVHTGIALVTGTEDRQWLYPAMTRGTDANLAFVVHHPGPARRPAARHPARPRTRPLRPPPPRTRRIPARPRPPPPTRQAGPARADRRARRHPRPRRRRTIRLGDPAAQPGQRRPPGHPARHLDRRNHAPPATTATATWSRPRCRPATGRPLSHQARWLYRTLHAAELAGLDPAEVIRTAIASRDLAGARDIAAVLDARIRPRVDPLLPQPQGPWTSRVPRPARPRPSGLPGRDRRMMDDRTQRLGQHAAQTGPAWAVTASARCPPTGRPPRLGDTRQPRSPPTARYTATTTPATRSAPSPAAEAPDQRAAWHEAFAALGPADGPDVRGHARRPAVAAPRHLRRRDRLGTPPRRQGTTAGPARRLRRRPGRHPRRR